MKIVTIVLFSCIFLSHIFSQSEKLLIEGSMRLGQSDTANPGPGTIRWSGSDFEGWNGYVWVSLSNRAITGIVMDTSGNNYYTIQIGTQVWMAANLKTTKYRNGDAITNVTDNTTWQNANFGAWCLYDNNSNFDNPYGKLYNWFALKDSRGLCPTGWHVPNSTEFTVLITLLGGNSIAGGKLKESGTDHWLNPNLGATNESYFNALPAGSRGPTLGNGFFSGIYEITRFWTSENTPTFLLMLNTSAGLGFDFNSQTSGYSVRCIKD
jgi:uncharacterized protein (TIGR02145 family)